MYYLPDDYGQPVFTEQYEMDMYYNQVQSKTRAWVTEAYR